MNSVNAAGDDAEVGTPMGVQILAFLCGLVVVYLGCKSTWQDYSRIKKFDRLDGLLETSGRFIQVKVRRDTTGSEDDYYPDILYEYFVAGKSIWGWRLSYEEEPKPKAFWEARLAGYKQGTPVPVYYDADAPKDAIVEKKHDGLGRIWLKMALGGGFVLVGLVLALLPPWGWFKKFALKK